MNSLNYDEPRIAKNKALAAGNIWILARQATRLLAILCHPQGAPDKPCGVVALLDKVTYIACGARLATELAGRVIIQRIHGTGH